MHLITCYLGDDKSIDVYYEIPIYLTLEHDCLVEELLKDLDLKKKGIGLGSLEKGIVKKVRRSYPFNTSIGEIAKGYVIERDEINKKFKEKFAELEKLKIDMELVSLLYEKENKILVKE